MNLEEKNVGVFIDAENVSYNDLPYIMMEAKKFGRLIVNRVYADWSTPIAEKWKQCLINYALEPVHCMKLPKKNSVDIKMIDDIYDILYFRGDVDVYVLVSNDLDYLTCSRKIKLLGKYLITFGYGNCSYVLRNVSDKFVNISLLNMKEDSIEINTNDEAEYFCFEETNENNLERFQIKIKALFILKMYGCFEFEPIENNPSVFKNRNREVEDSILGNRYYNKVSLRILEKGEEFLEALLES